MNFVAAIALAVLDRTDTNIFEPVSKPAEVIRDVAWLSLAVTGAIFVVVFALLIYVVIRFRHRDESDDREPAQVYGSNQIELAWTVVPALIVVVLSLVTVRGVFDLDKRTPPEGSLQVTVVGHQWWWEFQYPDLGITTANELHIPVDEVTFLTLESADVIHSFWVPRLAGKTDVIPNRQNHMWLEPHRPGLYVGQCAEYCGTQHARMLLRVYVHPREDFDRWVAEQTGEITVDPAVATGRDLFLTLACINCHSDRGTPANGVFGPDLTHLMSRDTLASGTIPNTPENLRNWVRDPQTLKPGARMPNMQLTDAEVDQIVAYLLTLK